MGYNQQTPAQIFDAYRTDIARIGQTGRAEELLAQGFSPSRLEIELMFLVETRGDRVRTSDCKAPTGGGRKVTRPLDAWEPDLDANALSCIAGNRD